MKHNEIILTNQAHPRLTANAATSTSNGTAILYVDTGSGYIELGPANGSHCHIQTDRSNFYFNKELRVNSGIIGSYDEDLILRRANSSSHQMVIDTTEVSTPLNLDVEGVIEFTSHSHELKSERAQNIELKTGTAGAGGLLLRNNTGSVLAQLYGDGSNYGFLDGTWGGWDIQKSINGKLYLNGNTTYFLQPEASNSAKFAQFVQIGNSSSYATNSGSWGARLNVTDDVHAKIEVGQDADSMLSHWYAHTGHTAIKFGTSSAHNVDLQRAGSTSIQIQAGGTLFYVPIRRNSHHASGFLEGSYNNVGANGVKTNPIYTIGSNYNPNETSLNNMYGIGFARSDASYLSSFTGSSGNTWGMYVAGDGDARIWLDAQEGQVFTSAGYRVGNTVVIDASRNISAVQGSFTDKVIIGTEIGSRTKSLSIDNNDDSSPLAVKTNYSTVFSVLPWSGGETYIASGIYYDDGSWVHASPDTTNCLFKLDGSGVTWYSSNNSSGSWNVASDVDLWDNTGTWVGQVDTPSSVDAASGFRVNGTTVIDSSRNITAGQLTVGGNLFNNSNSSYDIGQSNLRFNKLFIQNTIDSKGAFASYGTDTSYGVVRITHPDGADRHSRAGTETGAIKIVLPVSWTNTMMRMTVQIYEYSTGRSFTLYCGGYNYSSSSAWINPFAQIISSGNIVRDFKVRFGHDGSKCCIYIGELTSTWSYPQVTVTDFQAGFSAATTENWDNDWDITLEASAFQNVNATISTADIGRHHDDIFVNGTEVIDNNRVLQNVTLKAGGSGSRFEQNSWHQSADGYNRFYFASASHTYFRTGSAYVFRDNGDTGRATISAHGGANLLSGGDGHVASNVALAVGGTTVIDSNRNLQNIPTIAGNITVDNGTSTTLTVKCDNGGNAIVRAGGDAQGTGVFEVTQDGSYGGGMSYNGDASPGWASGETADHITFYRMDAGTRTEVFHYPYSSSVVNFNSTPTAGGNTIWHAGNDGPSSGLDADTVDGIQAASTVHKLNNSGYYRPNTWIDFRDSGTAGLYWGSGAAAGWHLHPTNTGIFKLRSGNSSYAQIDLTCDSDTRRGALYANDSNQVGLLDSSGYWAIRHYVGSGTEFRKSNTPIASIGAGLVTGSFGSMVVNDTKGGYGGYSINNRVVFMHNNANTSGIYNDVNNQWMVRTENGGEVQLYHNGDQKFQTTGDGILVSGMLRGGLGAATTSGTGDWNHSTNARSGQGHTLLFGDATNGPHSGQSGKYYHPISFEYNSKDGTGNLCQFAIPYAHNDFGPYFRTRYSGTWAGWVELWHSGNDGDGSGLDADLLDGVHKSSFVRTDQSSTILSGNSLNFQTSSGNTRGIINASETIPHLRIATSGNESIGFYDGGTSGTENIRIEGAGHLNLYTGDLKINDLTVISSSRHIQNIASISMNDGGELNAFTTSTTGGGKVNLPRGGFITFYGNGATEHSISSRNGSGGVDDDIRINSYGAVFVNLDSNGNDNNAAHSSFFIGKHGQGTNTITNLFKVDGENANVTTSGNVTAYGSPSDIRLKENVERISDPIHKVKQLDGITFDYKKDGSRSTGLIAQQLLEVLPEVVYETEDLHTGDTHYAVRYGNVVGLLVEAIKEQQTQLTAQQEQINQLTTLVNKLMEK